mgnify:FL=1
MENNFKISKQVFNYRPADVFNDRETKNKIDRHLLDINDVISEDDIRNIKVSFPVYDNAPRYSNSNNEGSLNNNLLADA